MVKCNSKSSTSSGFDFDIRHLEFPQEEELKNFFVWGRQESYGMLGSRVGVEKCEKWGFGAKDFSCWRIQCRAYVIYRVNIYLILNVNIASSQQCCSIYNRNL